MNLPAGDIRDIRGPILVTTSHLWTYVAVALALVTFAVLLAALVRRRRRRPLTPGTAALRALDALVPLVERGEVLAFSTRVSDAVRRYVEAAFAVRAPRRTTEELLLDLMVDGGPVAAHRDELNAFLHHCDLAKYARARLSTGEMSALLASAKTFVKATLEISTGGHP